MKRPRTDSKQIRKQIRKHIIEIINTENYEEDNETLKRSLEIIADEVQHSAFFENNIRIHKTFQDAFIDWLRGLPTCLNAHFRYFEINEFMESIGLPQAEKEDETDSANLYYYLIFSELYKMMQENNIEFIKLTK